MELLIEIHKSLIYVAQSDYFWQAMAADTTISMFIGSLLYNGDLTQLKKAIISLLSYGGMIMLTNIARITASTAGITRSLMSVGQAFNGTTTVLYVTIFYMIGIALGVWVHKYARR